MKDIAQVGFLTEDGVVRTVESAVKSPEDTIQVREKITIESERVILPTDPEKAVIASEIQDVKTRTRFLTGQVKYNDLISEEKALAAAFKKAEQASRKAYSVGKQEGTATERARKQDLIDKQRAIKKQKDYMRKLATGIAREPGIGVDYYYAEAIQALQADIDPAFRAERTLHAREQRKAFLERNPEMAKQMPAKLLAELEKKPLNELSVKELEELKGEIDHLRKLGKKKRELLQLKDKRAFDQSKTLLLEEIYGGEEAVITEGKGKASHLKEAWRTIGKAISAWTLRPQRLLDSIDGGKNFRGRNFRYLYERAQKITNRALIGTDNRVQAGRDKMKELGITQKVLAKKHEIDGIIYTTDEVIDIYLGYKNELKKAAITWGNNLDPATGEKFISQLSAKEKEWGDWLLSEYDANYERLKKAHIEYTNRAIGHEENYTPIRRMDADWEMMKDEVGSELLERQGLRKAYAERGFTISRENIPEGFQNEIRLGATSTWMEQVAKQENYIQNAKDIRSIQQVVNDREWTAAVRQMKGSEYVKAVQKWANLVSNPSYYQQYDAAHRLSSNLRKNTAICFLAYNLTTAGKQLPSAFLFLPEAGPKHLIGSALQALIHPRKMVENMHALSPQMKNRQIEREMEELKHMDRSVYNKIRVKVGSTGMMLIYAMDKAAITIGWNAVYQKELRNGNSEAGAAMEADNATLRTQPAANAKDLAQLYTSNEALNWLTMFSNQINQIYNMFAYDVPMRARQGSPEMIMSAALGMMGIAISGLGIWAMSNRRLPEQPEDYKDAVSEQFVNSIPLVGRIVTEGAKGFRGGEIPPVEALKSLGYAGFSEGKFNTRMKKALEAAAVIGGWPYTGPKRVYNFLKEGDVSELWGGKPRK